MRKMFVVLSAAAMLVRCGAPPTNGITDGGNGSGGGGGSGSGGGTGGGAASSTEVPSEFASLIASKDCPGFPNTPAVRTKLTSSFQIGMSRGCESFINQAYACQKSAGTSGLTCIQMFGVNDIRSNLPACTENFAVAIACTGAVNAEACYSISCSRDLDCPSGLGCNDQTGHCFSQTATCLGLPCQRSLDCSTGATCNTSMHVCVKS